MISSATLVRAFVAVVIASALGLGMHAAAPASVQDGDGDDEFSAHGFDTLRIEEEDKLWVPQELEEQVWVFLQEHFANGSEALRGLDPEFKTRNSTEAFSDTYYDTPALQLYDQQSGARHRTRFNLTNGADRKNGRELMQLKLNHVSDTNPLMRGELKYEIRYPTQIEQPEDAHPMLGIVKPSQREAIKRRLSAIGVDALALRPVVTVDDTRRRIYFDKQGVTTLSITLDHVTSHVWWASTKFCEIEPELNEIVFTEADAEKRARMEAMLTTIVGDICTHFPGIARNLTPKYNKTFDAIEQQLPCMRFLVRNNLTSTGVMLSAIAGVVVLCALIALLVRERMRRRRAQAEYEARSAQPVT